MPDRYNISIVTYTNEVTDLERCLASIQRQGVNTKIIVVDNLGSAVVKELIKGLPEVDYYSLPNPGFGAAHNFATTKFDASGYRVFLNPDIVLEIGCLQEIANCFNANPEVVLLSPMLYNTDGSQQQFVRNYPSIVNMVKRVFLSTKNNFIYNSEPFCSAKFMHGAFFVLNNKLETDQFGFDERYFLYLEDIDFCISMRERGDIGIATRASATHRHMKQSRKISKLTLYHLRSFIQFWMKNGTMREKRP